VKKNSPQNTSTHDGNIGGVRLITQKSLHALTGQRTVSYQEAAHMVDNQDLTICSEKITYASLQQGAVLRSEKDKKDTEILNMYRNRRQEYYHLTLTEYFYQVYCKEVFKKDDDVDRTKHRIIMPRGMNCKPCYPIDHSYAKGMLIMHKPWNKKKTLEALLKDKDKCIAAFKQMIDRKQLPSSVIAQYICAMKYSHQKRLEIIAKEGTQEPINVDRLSAEEREKYIAFQQCSHFSDNKVHDDKISGMNVDIGQDVDWTTLRYAGERKVRIPGEQWMKHTTKKFYKTAKNRYMFDAEELIIPKTKQGQEYNVDSSKEQRKIVYSVVDTVIKFLTNDPSYRPFRATIMGCGGTGKSYVINTIITLIRRLTSSNDTIQIAAPSGSAAFNVQGSTLHRLLKIGVKHPEDPLSEKNRELLTKQLERLLVLIIDERSQINSSILATSERNIRQCIYNGQNSTEYFGGLPVVLLFGDDYQLMPVASEGAIQGYAAHINVTEPSKKSRQSRNALLMIRHGHFLFREIMTENVFFLTKNYRVKCKRFKKLLHRVRLGTPSNKDVDTIMNLHLTFYQGDKEFIHRITNDEKTMYLFTNNADKDKMNGEKLVETSKNQNKPVARLDCWFDTNKLQGGKERQPIKSHFDDHTKYVRHTDICVGARVSIISHNFLPEVGLYNGAIGTVIEIVYKSSPAGPNDKEHRHLPDYVVVDFPHLNLPSHIDPWDTKNPTVSNFVHS